MQKQNFQLQKSVDRKNLEFQEEQNRARVDS